MDMTVNLATQHGIEQTALNSETSCPKPVSAGEQSRFESALNGQPEAAASIDPVKTQVSPAAGRAGLGDAILHQLEAMHSGCDVAQSNMNEHLARIKGGESNVADVIQLQRDLLNLNLQTTFASKVSEEVNQGVQTMIKSQ